MVYDAAGRPQGAALSEDGTSLKRAEIAMGKAYGALALGVGSRALHKMATDRPYFVAAATPCGRRTAGAGSGRSADQGRPRRGSSERSEFQATPRTMTRSPPQRESRQRDWSSMPGPEPQKLLKPLASGIDFYSDTLDRSRVFDQQMGQGHAVSGLIDIFEND